MSEKCICNTCLLEQTVILKQVLKSIKAKLEPLSYSVIHSYGPSISNEIDEIIHRIDGVLK
jgi:hypothetical protein